MHRAAVRVLGAVALIAGVSVFTVQREPVRGIDLDASRLISSEQLPEVLEACSWDLATAERPAGGAVNRPGLQARGAGAGQPQSIGDPNVAARMPIRTIRDPLCLPKSRNEDRTLHFEASNAGVSPRLHPPVLSRSLTSAVIHRNADVLNDRGDGRL